MAQERVQDTCRREHLDADTSVVVEHLEVTVCNFEDPKKEIKRDSQSDSSGLRYKECGWLSLILLWPCVSAAWKTLFAPCFAAIVKSGKKSRAIAGLMWLLLISMFLYGLDMLWKYNGFYFPNVELEDFQGRLFVARISGKAIGASLMLALLAVFKPVVEAIEGTMVVRGRINWRQLHYHCITISVLMSFIHGLMHFLNQRRESMSEEVATGRLVIEPMFWSLENYSGVLLWLLFFASGFTIWLQQVLDILPKNTDKDSFMQKHVNGRQSSCRRLSKMWFRFTHLVIAGLFMLLYTLHAKDVWPLVFLLVWKVFRTWYRVPIKDCKYRILIPGIPGYQSRVEPGMTDEYIMEVKFESRTVMPVDFGYYCVLSHGLCFASYSMIPLKECEFMFRIRKCTLTESFVGRLWEHRGADNWNQYNRWYSFNSNEFLIVRGPYKSSTYSLANARRGLAVFVTDTGSAVSDTMIRFLDEKKGYWKKLAVFNMGADSLKYCVSTAMREESYNTPIASPSPALPPVRPRSKPPVAMGTLRRFPFFAHNPSPQPPTCPAPSLPLAASSSSKPTQPRRPPPRPAVRDPHLVNGVSATVLGDSRKEGTPHPVDSSQCQRSFITEGTPFGSVRAEAGSAVEVEQLSPVLPVFPNTSGAAPSGGVLQSHVSQLQRHDPATSLQDAKCELHALLDSQSDLVMMNWKNMNVDICEYIMKYILSQGFHIMICSRRWTDMYEQIIERDKKTILQRRRQQASSAKLTPQGSRAPLRLGSGPLEAKSSKALLLNPDSFLLNEIAQEHVHIETFEL
eukprot:g3909.t1